MPKAIIEYTVVVGDPLDHETFLKSVNKLLGEGWELNGAPALGGEGREGHVIAQAMTRDLPKG